MILKRNGVTRIVFVFGRFVVKIPNFTCQHDHFLIGCAANWKERKYWKQWRNVDESYRFKICPTLFCSWFGLIQIQAKAKILTRDLTEDEVMFFGDISKDSKGTNFGYYNGRLVCVDYA